MFLLQLCVRFMRECIAVDTVCEFIQVMLHLHKYVLVCTKDASFHRLH